MAIQTERNRNLLCVPVAASYNVCASRLLCGKRVRQMQQRRKRYQIGSVVLDPRTQTWFFRWYEGKTRKAERIGTTKQYPTKADAMRAAEGMRLRINNPEASPAVTSDQVAQRYILERMPRRHSTSRGYKGKLKIIQRDWGTKTFPLKAEVEQWLRTLKSTSTGNVLCTENEVTHQEHSAASCTIAPCCGNTFPWSVIR